MKDKDYNASGNAPEKTEEAAPAPSPREEKQKKAERY